MNNGPSPRKIELAVRAIAALEARGETVNGRSVGRECGWYVSPDQGLNGRDAQAYREAMAQSGYARVDHGSVVRYVRTT